MKIMATTQVNYSKPSQANLRNSQLSKISNQNYNSPNFTSFRLNADVDALGKSSRIVLYKLLKRTEKENSALLDIKGECCYFITTGKNDSEISKELAGIEYLQSDKYTFSHLIEDVKRVKEDILMEKIEQAFKI